MITITESKLQYKALNGGVTRRVPEHFAKRSVRFEIDGEERRIDIDKADLPISVIEDEVIAYIEANTEKTTIVNEQMKTVQVLVERIKTATEIYEENKDKTDILIEDLKLLKINVLKEDCSEAIYGGFTVQGMHFGMNNHDQQNMTQQLLLIVAGQTENVQWNTKNVGVVVLTPAQFSGVANAAKNHKMSEQAKYWGLEQLVAAATTNEEIKSIKW